MCLYTKLRKNKKYESNKKNGGDIPPLPKIKVNGKWIDDKRVLAVPTKCGKCIECRKQKAREWNVRLNEEIRNEKMIGQFVTLTFNEKSFRELYYESNFKKGYKKDNEIARLGVRRFLERWRKEFKKSVKHWLVTEIGGTHSERIHIHGIIWTNEEISNIRKHWRYGYVWVSGENKGWVNEVTVNYITKYINKQDLKHPNYISKIFSSQGIGNGYLKRKDSKNNIYKGIDTDESYINRQGFKMGLPTYLRNKIYTDEEREKLWQKKLDENVRWVMGQKIDVSNGDEMYKKVRAEARKINKRLKYGKGDYSDKLKEEEREENERRNINHIRNLRNAEEQWKNEASSHKGTEKF
ncbi:MAG: replication initiator protein [Malazfec virus 3]